MGPGRFGDTSVEGVELVQHVYSSQEILLRISISVA
jgi:hypothetical protein